VRIPSYERQFWAYPILRCDGQPQTPMWNTKGASTIAVGRARAEMLCHFKEQMTHLEISKRAPNNGSLTRLADRIEEHILASHVYYFRCFLHTGG